MKFTLSWLLDHLDTEAGLDDIVERLPLLGLEVEGVENKGEELAAFTVAYVKEAAAHPDADRLKVCTVDTGAGEVQVVCGAPNARTGMKGVFAPVGSWIPGTEMELKSGVIRGVDSNGMLVSEREMGLSDEHTGIIEAPEDASVGAPFAKVMGLDDPVIDIAITPNRADCLGVRGVARDLAAAGLGRLKPLQKTEPLAGSFESPVLWQRDLPKEKANACPFVAGRYFRGVTNGESPKWMQDRLRAIGLRPISALVDITNYVSYDLGRPLHVFDAQKIAGNLTMRMASEGETIEALDERTYELDAETVVIADDKEVHGIGGIMGGEASGVTSETTEVFLEVALFDPVRIAASGRRLGILSDARYRFERGVDPTSAEWGAELAARLILEICGGEASEAVSAGDVPDWRREITLRPARIAELGGLEVPQKQAAQVLEELGFELSAGDGLLTAAVPPWRSDVEGEADLVEEVLRIVGFDNIPVVPLDRETTLSQPAINPRQKREHLARTALAWCGMDEVVTFSFMSGEIAELFGGVADHLHLVNPISSDLDVMRQSILPNLLQAAGRNADRVFGD
ncbi:MAG: phenylalanine--tRNA ligase subunit beta, partial [Rhodovibrionaceae bacterium]|nr:phenylalanine--tRNA ligase subunit beta [Rhodovibrionaceae bacterium]